MKEFTISKLNPQGKPLSVKELNPLGDEPEAWVKQSSEKYEATVPSTAHDLWQQAESNLKEFPVQQEGEVDIEKFVLPFYKARGGKGDEISLPDYLIDAFKADLHSTHVPKKVWVERDVKVDGLPKESGWYKTFDDGVLYFSKISESWHHTGSVHGTQSFPSHWLEQLTINTGYSLDQIKKAYFDGAEFRDDIGNIPKEYNWEAYIEQNNLSKSKYKIGDKVVGILDEGTNSVKIIES